MSPFAVCNARPILPFLLLAMLLAFVGCGPASTESDEPFAEAQDGPVATIQEPIIDCSEYSDTGYVQGQAFTITLVTVDGKPVERDTANALWVMQQAAAADGIHIQVTSGFRTMAEQQYLYGCYVNCSCNNCNLAAKPGYSNHQSGHALDLNTGSSGVYNWLTNHASQYGFSRTVASENWHWEWWGGGPGGGPCGGCEAHCEGSVIVDKSCGKGDCAAFGSTCVDDGLGVRCVFAYCPAQGDVKVCLDDRMIGQCHNGAIETGDCGAFGAYCSTAGVSEARCVSVFCVADPGEAPVAHDVCLPDGRVAHCNAEGAVEDAQDCPGGKVCHAGETGGRCIGAHTPRGHLDVASCDEVAGWAQDEDQADGAIEVHLYFGGPAGDTSAVGLPVSANVDRDELCTAIGSCEHGFRAPMPLSLLDGAPHPIHAYGIDGESGPNAELEGSPLQVECDGVIPAGVRRHVQDPESFAAWQLSTFHDLLPASDEEIDASIEAVDWPVAPQLVQADDGSPEVWLIDGAWRRHVTNMESFAAWHFSLGAVTELPAKEVYALERGRDLRARPVMVCTSSGAVYLIDDAPGAYDASTPPGAVLGEPPAGPGAGGYDEPLPPDGYATDRADPGACSIEASGVGAGSGVGWLCLLSVAWLSWRRNRKAVARRRSNWFLLGLTCLVAFVAGCGGPVDEPDDGTLGVRTDAVSAPLGQAYCEASVQGIGTISAEDDYLPHVITCENGGASLEALKAQAIAARSVLYYNMATTGSICDGQGCQVYSCGAQPAAKHYQAVKETAGMYLSYAGMLTYGFYVAGDSNTSAPSCKGASGATEHYVTYNEGKTGGAVTQTSLGYVGPPGYGQNRGCMGQWGARCLENQKGYGYADILRFYYGADIQILTAPGSCTGCEARCDGTKIINADCSSGDCAVFGSSCVDDALGPRCVFAYCPPEGDVKVCLDEQIIGQCHNGAVETGDCGAYGAYCSTAGATEARCVSVFCVEGPNTVPAAHDVCLPDGQLASCDENGGFGVVDPCPSGKTCADDGSGARCIGANEPTVWIDRVDHDRVQLAEDPAAPTWPELPSQEGAGPSAGWSRGGEASSTACAVGSPGTVQAGASWLALAVAVALGGLMRRGQANK